jgi:hypothetical protein
MRRGYCGHTFFSVFFDQVDVDQDQIAAATSFGDYAMVRRNAGYADSGQALKMNE